MALNPCLTRAFSPGSYKSCFNQKSLFYFKCKCVASPANVLYARYMTTNIIGSHMCVTWFIAASFAFKYTNSCNLAVFKSKTYKILTLFSLSQRWVLSNGRFCVLISFLYNLSWPIEVGYLFGHLAFKVTTYVKNLTWIGQYIDFGFEINLKNHKTANRKFIFPNHSWLCTSY